MELLRGNGELRGVGAYFRQRAQPGVPEERGVFHALGHDHAGGLLEADPEFRSGPRIEQQRQERFDGVAKVRTAPDGQLAGLPEDVRALRQVAAVHRERRDDLGQRVRSGFLVQSRFGRDQACQPEHLRVQDPVRDPAFGAADHLVVVRGLSAAQLGVDGVEHFLAAGVDKHPVHVGEGVVARGALAIEPGRKFLARLQDFLNQQVAAARGCPQPAQVSSRIGQAVRVVDPQPVHQAFIEPPDNLRVGFVEDLGKLHPDPGQGVDGEEPAVVQLVVRPAPADQFVVLPVVDLAGVIGSGVTCGIGALGERKTVIVVAQFPVPDLKRVHVRVRAQHGEPDAAAAKVPVDVERLGIAGLPAFLQERPPPRVLDRRRHADMVGHDIDQNPHAGFPGGRATLPADPQGRPGPDQWRRDR